MAHEFRYERWRALSEFAANELKGAGTTLVDAYLVGSSAPGSHRTPLYHSDIDSLLIIRDELSLHELWQVRRQLCHALAKLDEDRIYHFKLLTGPEFKLFSAYDSFRLAEFRSGSRSLRRSGCLSMHEPRFSIRALCNSLLVQAVYLACTGTHQPEPIAVRQQLLERAGRNLELLAASGYNFEISPKEMAVYCASRDPLLRFACACLGAGQRPSLRTFLRRYFTRVRHEYVNKWDAYKGAMYGPATLWQTPARHS